MRKYKCENSIQTGFLLSGTYFFSVLLASLNQYYQRAFLFMKYKGWNESNKLKLICSLAIISCAAFCLLLCGARFKPVLFAGSTASALSLAPFQLQGCLHPQQYRQFLPGDRIGWISQRESENTNTCQRRCHQFVITQAFENKT